MSLEIRHKEGFQTWYINEEFILVPCLAEVETVRANDDELEYILNRFVNLPYKKGNSCVWYEETARFIVGNLS